jgi:hypothetical protein
MPTTPRYLEQGPEPMPRNRLADWAREYGLYGLSNKLNDPTSGLGLAADAIGGLGNALIVQPAQSFNRLLTEGYRSQDPQSAEDAFNAAGAAMVGGLAAPRPKAAPTPQASTFTGYRGAPDAESAFRGPAVWASSDRNVANTYATLADEAPNVTPVEMRFSNPRVIDAQGANYRRVPYGDGQFMGTDQIARLARNDGHDGVVFNNIRDNVIGQGDPATSSAALQPGTVYSPLTGELLYANGGRPGAAVGAAANAAAEKQGIRAYHGSPHDFDRFDMSKIGTGEGAQAFGHGLYFAENEGVAKSYKNALSGQRFKDGSVFNDANPAHQASAYVSGTKSKDEAIAAINDDIAMSRRQMDEKHAQILLRAKGMLERGENIPELNNGRLYEVRINASPDDFLDWDKPLSQQSEKVRKAIGYDEQAGNRYDEISKRLGELQWQQGGLDSPEWTSLVREARSIREKMGSSGPQYQGEEYARSLLDAHGKQGAAQKMREAGIPGIKYLDQGSRTAGDGSRNYVVFDDNLIEILRKYGLLGMIGGSAVAGGLQPDQNKQTDWARKMQPGDA